MQPASPTRAGAGCACPEKCCSQRLTHHCPHSTRCVPPPLLPPLLDLLIVLQLLVRRVAPCLFAWPHPR